MERIEPGFLPCVNWKFHVSKGKGMKGSSTMTYHVSFNMGSGLLQNYLQKGIYSKWEDPHSYCENKINITNIHNSDEKIFQQLSPSEGKEPTLSTCLEEWMPSGRTGHLGASHTSAAGAHQTQVFSTCRNIHNPKTLAFQTKQDGWLQHSRIISFPKELALRSWECPFYFKKNGV